MQGRRGDRPGHRMRRGEAVRRGEGRSARGGIEGIMTDNHGQVVIDERRSGGKGRRKGADIEDISRHAGPRGGKCHRQVGERQGADEDGGRLADAQG